MKELSPDFTEFVEKKLRFPEKPLTSCHNFRTSQVVKVCHTHRVKRKGPAAEAQTDRAAGRSQYVK